MQSTLVGRYILTAAEIVTRAESGGGEGGIPRPESGHKERYDRHDTNKYAPPPDIIIFEEGTIPGRPQSLTRDELWMFPI